MFSSVLCRLEVCLLLELVRTELLASIPGFGIMTSQRHALNECQPSTVYCILLIVVLKTIGSRTSVDLLRRTNAFFNLPPGMEIRHDFSQCGYVQVVLPVNQANVTTLSVFQYKLIVDQLSRNPPVSWWTKTSVWRGQSASWHYFISILILSSHLLSFC